MGKIIGWGCAIIAALLLLSAIGAGIGYVGGWFNQGARIINPENIHQTWNFAYEYRQSMDATAANVCGERKALEASNSPEEKTARNSQILAYSQNYARIEAQYDAKFRNLLEGKLIKPNDLEYPAPTLEQDILQVCH
jgi:hypothetical protein